MSVLSACKELCYNKNRPVSYRFTPFVNGSLNFGYACIFNNVCVASENSVILILRLSMLGPVVQSVVSLTRSLRVISLTVLVDSVHNILLFFAEKNFSIFAYHSM